MPISEQDISELLAALRAQTAAIQALADSNYAIVRAMIDADDLQEDIRTHLDGSRIG